MTDERYTFIQDVREKKATGRGAFAKRTGSKSRKCTMPSDYLTAAQKKKLNGEIKTMNTNKPLTYAELKALPEHMQSEYLDTVCRVHSASKSDIALMLGISASTVGYLSKGKFADVHFFPASGKRTQAHNAAWHSFLAGGIDTPAQEEDVSQRTTEPSAGNDAAGNADSAPDTQEETAPMLVGGSVVVEGVPADSIKMLYALFSGLKAEYKLTLTWEIK